MIKDMARITIEQAENMMFDLLGKEDMGDRIYEFAQALFVKYIDKIEAENQVINKDILDRCEEWYDHAQDEFFQTVYDRITKFMMWGEQ